MILAVVNFGLFALNVWLGFGNHKRKSKVALGNMFAAGVAFAATLVCILNAT
ncbi:MAG: hypothetical protein KAS32_09470 [Candidatus Peribacteraceae bacterium]|nr:hypothetical protein [Candidatus Peribacteraceae bacterium]